MTYLGPRKVLVTGGSGFIGIHLVENLKSLGYVVLNLDIKSPIDNRNLNLWRNVSILDNSVFRKEVLEFAPNYIVHLSATTKQDSTTLEDFPVNVEGTRNLINIANELKNLNKFVFTSTQYVNTPGNSLSDDSSKLLPYGFYGQSKLIGEELIRRDYLNNNWTIIRPTNIWGPWHFILTNGLWKQIIKKRYFHPKGDSAIKAYGYVKNTAWQIVQLLELENELTSQQIFYLADYNLAQKHWVNSFVFRLSGREIKEIPKIYLYFISEIGELLVRMKIRFPLYRSRYRNLITSNPCPLDKTNKLLGSPPIRFEDGIEETCTWLEDRVSKNVLAN